MQVMKNIVIILDQKHFGTVLYEKSMAKLWKGKEILAVYWTRQ